MVRIAGRGAYGTAYLARRKTDGREVILKQIPIEQLNSADRQSILTEIKVLSMLHHPNVIEYYENFLQDKAMMIVMEFAAGGTLFDLLEMRRKEGKYLEEAELLHLFAQIVLSMFYVHQNQILHRDLKSQNIFLTRSQDHVKIGDFGISKILSTKSKAFTVVGTPCYISPELCEGKPYNAKSDVWALGCVLYELCALKRAFEAPTLPALILKIMRGVISPIPAQFSPGARQLLASLLALEPSKRPSLAEMMSHHWLAPAIFRLPTRVGLIPCTARPARPLALLRPEEVREVREDSRRGSPSVFLHGEETRASFRWRPGELPVRLAALDPRSELVDLGLSDSGLAAVETSGKVITWEEGGEVAAKHCSGLAGISIVKVGVGGRFLCLLTDRGILLTRGEGRHGCLGHGDTRDLELPKIVEALLGDHIAEISAGEKHLAVLTGDGEVFTWGEDSGGCLAQGKLSSSLLTRPELLELEEDVAAVVCASQATAVIAPDGRLMVAGSNNNNRLGLDTPGHTVENSSLLTPLLSLGPVLNLSIGESCSLVLSRSREVWRLGGEGRAVTRLDLGLDSVGLVVALPTSGALLTTQGHLYTFGYRKSNKTRINIEEERERNKQKIPLKFIKNNKGTCLLHFQLT